MMKCMVKSLAVSTLCVAAALLKQPQRATATSGVADKQQLLSELKRATRAYYFRSTNGQRSLVGTLDPASTGFREFAKALAQAKLVAVASVVTADSELAMVGPSLQLVARINSRSNEVTLLQVRKWKATQSVTLRLNKSSLPKLRSVVTNYSAPPHHARSVPRSMSFACGFRTESLYDLVTGRKVWEAKYGPRPPVVVVIARVVSVTRNVHYQNPEWKDGQFTTFELAVERYLKDETELNLPVIKYSQGGGQLDGGQVYYDARLLLEGERYLLFLRAPQPGDPWSFEFLDGEFMAILPLANTWLVDGKTTATVDLSPNVISFTSSRPTLSNELTMATLHFRPEADVIAEVEYAIAGIAMRIGSHR